ncbi:hypothetical protein CR956_01560 [Candidatus Saccharibacteria bacterium]|nr:MAG: hypothetical protein CR956_01560 [Candidatus Saccharibacteria bacterium]
MATGHYARTKNGKLLMAKDADKDQTYFLYRVDSKALESTVFPLGDYTKKQVRQLAKRCHLWTADKKESMGVCFVGQVGMREFLSQYVQTRPGDIVDETGQKLGRHDGAIFYTIGQRHGLDLGGGLPYYVTGKDVNKNLVYVSRNLQSAEIWRDEFQIDNLHWISGQAPNGSLDLRLRIRHRAPLVDCRLEGNQVKLDQAERAITAGQSAVFYAGEECLGGGIVS